MECQSPFMAVQWVCVREGTPMPSLPYHRLTAPEQPIRQDHTVFTPGQPPVSTGLRSTSEASNIPCHHVATNLVTQARKPLVSRSFFT